METKKTLYRNTDNRMLGGVASGLAEYMDWDVTVVRLIFLFCLFCIPGAMLAYIVSWIIIPDKFNPHAGLSFGKILLLILFFFLPVILVLGLFGLIFIPMILSFLAVL